MTGTAVARRGTRRRNRNGSRPTVRRLRASIIVGPYTGISGDYYVQIKAGPNKGTLGVAKSLRDLGLRIPRGRARITVTTAADGAWRCDSWPNAILKISRHDQDPERDGMMFCWLPRKFRGKRVDIAVSRAR